jgi:transcriptional regulator with XRE-family HTH domain
VTAATGGVTLSHVSDAAEDGLTEEPVSPHHLGPELRRVRQARSLSLADVASETGISRSLLSLIETGRSDITLGRLMRLATLYGMHVTDLLAPPDAADPIVMRGGEATHIYSPSEGFDMQFLVPGHDRRMLPWVAVIEESGGGTDFVGHDGEEFVFVLEGRTRLEFEDGETPVQLDAGDSTYYRSERPHRLVNAGRGAVRALVVSTPPHW